MGPGEWMSVGGVALLALCAWWRTPTRAGGPRRWVSSEVDRYAIVLVLPGIGLLLASVWPLTSYDPALAPLGGQAWKLLALLPGAVGAVMAGWGMLALPFPRFLLPRWVRAYDAAHGIDMRSRRARRRAAARGARERAERAEGA